MLQNRPPLPPFALETAVQKVRLAEDAWNSHDPERVALAYSTNSSWRNRAEFLEGRDAIVSFLTRKWQRELDYRLIRSSGPFATTASLYVLRMSGTTTAATGSEATVMRTGNSMSTA
jgi:nuclear transport factor 2 (NTF2) superfamily protein